MISRNNRTKKAFTLIELLVVIMIIAVLAAMIVPRILSRQAEAKKSAARSDLVNLAKMIELYRLDVGYYPTADEGLEALRTPPSDVSGWKGPYTTKPIPFDPWGNDYYYDWPGSDGDDSYILMSFGSDKSQGGAADSEAEDIIESGE